MRSETEIREVAEDIANMVAISKPGLMDESDAEERKAIVTTVKDMRELTADAVADALRWVLGDDSSDFAGTVRRANREERD
jgi:hypothetical protein